MCPVKRAIEELVVKNSAVALLQNTVSTHKGAIVEKARQFAVALLQHSMCPRKGATEELVVKIFAVASLPNTPVYMQTRQPESSR